MSELDSRFLHPIAKVKWSCFVVSIFSPSKWESLYIMSHDPKCNCYTDQMVEAASCIIQVQYTLCILFQYFFGYHMFIYVPYIQNLISPSKNPIANNYLFSCSSPAQHLNSPAQHLNSPTGGWYRQVWETMHYEKLTPFDICDCSLSCNETDFYQLVWLITANSHPI